MAIYACPVVNPGAENGRTAWVARTGGAAEDQFNSTANTGLKIWAAGDNAINKWDQEITLESGLLTEIDTGTVTSTYSAYHRGGGDSDSGYLYIEFYDSGHTLLDSDQNALSDPASFTLETIVSTVPANTRYIRIGTYNDRNSGTANSNFWDDFSLELEGDFPAEVLNIKAHQLAVYAWATQPAEYATASQLPVIAYAGSEGASGEYEIKTHQIGLYVWARPNGDRRELRAWTFKQDDHEFYGIQLGAEGTLVYDRLTSQWCQWKSPEEVYWRVEDVVDWEGINIGCDTESGKLWKIDPTGRLDYDTTPITSIVVGYLTHRFRTNTPCFMAELALSEGQPPAGFEDGSVGITLRTSTDDGATFIDHGTVDGLGISEDITVRWYGLGLMKSPGMLFEITDSGYARRLDGLDIEVADG